MDTSQGSADVPRFAAEFGRWREARGLSRAALARLMGYHRSYISKVASGTEHASREFAALADDALDAGGALRRAWLEQHVPSSDPAPPPSWTPAPVPDPTATRGLVVAHDDATLRYEDGIYRATMRRRLVNNGTTPITRYHIRISVDRYPGDPQRSNELYRNDPLTWAEIDLRAWHGEGRLQPMKWTVQHDRDAFKEVWLQFSDDQLRFPLYPGQSTWIEYVYSVKDYKWGHWFQRAVRLPTERMSVTLDLPREMGPSVWGLHTSMAAESMPFENAISERVEGDRVLYSWSTENPPLHARYRLEWHLRNGSLEGSHEKAARSITDTMSALGIVQEGDPGLRRTARPLTLPDDAEVARRIVTELASAARRVAGAHTFGKGLGVAAPQIGIDRAAAIVLPPDGEDPLVLLNPEIIESSAATDRQFEGCLSFFDVRCRVPRALTIHVRHTGIDGQERITIFENGMARLVAHEIDHLSGILCKDHMAPGEEPLPIEQYRGTGSGWNYGATA